MADIAEMTYSIEQTRDPNLEDTAIPNLYITDYLPDSPDGDYVKVYIYAYMCCKQGIPLTHEELSERLGIATSKIIEAWKYYSERCIVRLTPRTYGSETDFNVEFVDVKGVLFGRMIVDEEAAGKNDAELKDAGLAVLFQQITAICGDVTLDGSDMHRIISWIDDDGAAPEVIESAWRYCHENNKPISVNYVETIVKDWTGNGVKTAAEAKEHMAKRAVKIGVYKRLMKALGLQFRAPTPAEEAKFNLWIDEYEYTPERLLELAEGCSGTGNPMQYLEGIIRKERQAEGKSTDGMGKQAVSVAQRRLAEAKARNEYYESERAKNEKIREEHLKEVYEKLPEAEQIDSELVQVNNELVKTLISGRADKQTMVDRINQKIEKMTARRNDLLESAGFGRDYTDIRYSCSLCSDSGILESGEACGCFIRQNVNK
jgi:DnaD/phage-associated family protein